ERRRAAQGPGRTHRAGARHQALTVIPRNRHPEERSDEGSAFLSTMKISIVVPAFNEERLLPETLARVRSASAAFGGWDTELVVCDNNSTDRTAQIAREAGASVVFEPVNQISRARNAGAARASGEWLVFVDADSHPSPELFGEVRTQIAAGRCIAGGATVKYD